MEVMERKTPGSKGGGVAFPGLGGGKGGGGDMGWCCWYGLPGESGGEKSPSPYMLRDLLDICGGRRGGGRVAMVSEGEAVSVVGSIFRTSKDSKSSRGSWSHGPSKRFQYSIGK